MKPLVAITGATGFLGYNVAKTLFERGYGLRLLVRKDPRIDFRDGAPVELVPGDLSDERALSRLVRGADVVIHMAGLIKASRKADFDEVNVEGTEKLVTAIKDNKAEAKFIFVSSMAAREPALSAYAGSKAKAEEVVSARLNKSLILRPSAIYGPGDRETLILFKACRSWFQPMLNTKDARLCVVHVADVAEAIAISVKLLEQDGPLFGAYEITDERISGYSWLELIEEACRATNGRPRPLMIPSPIVRALGRIGSLHATLTGSAKMLSADKVNEILHSNWASSKARQLPQEIWIPRRKLKRGFEETVAWYRTQNWLS